MLVKDHYDDGGISGGHLDRPALQRLMADIDAGQIDRIMVYKIDRLTRSLTDFAKLVERLDDAGASFVSVTQSFNTATSMGRLTLNVLLSFAQFEREVTAERIRDKIAASKKLGLWMGGNVPLGYEAEGRTLHIIPEEAEVIRTLFELYEQLGTVTAVTKEAARLGLRSKRRIGRDGILRGGSILGRGQVHHVLSNPVYAGRIRHKSQVHAGRHDAIIDPVRFDAIQDRLIDRSAKQRHTPAAAHPFPLAGKFFDETGDRLTPSHAQKGNKRYRYYVSRRLVVGGRNTKEAGWRLRAERLEAGVLDAIKSHLIERIERGNIGQASAQTTEQLQKRVQDVSARLLNCLHEARLGDDILIITLDWGRLANALDIDENAISPQSLTFQRPFSQRRRGVEKRLIIGTATKSRDEILVRNVTRAEQWRAAILKGEALPTIAAREGVSVNYISQMLTFAFLSPKLVRLILEGRQPPALTTNWLRRHGLPASWVEQDSILEQL